MNQLWRNKRRGMEILNPKNLNNKIWKKLLSRTEGNEAGCIIWNGPTNERGYPRASINNKREYLIRVVWELFNPPIQKSHCIYHTCTNRLCINPEHLFITIRNQNKSDEERFWAKVKKMENGCWEWQGAKNLQGYGEFMTAGDSGHFEMAHRISWKLANGPIPDGMFICHHCDNPPCVNPAHLFLGTQKDNIQDMFSKNRQNYGKSAKLTPEQVVEIRNIYKKGNITYQKLAEKFNVQCLTIGSIIRKERWKEV